MPRTRFGFTVIRMGSILSSVLDRRLEKGWEGRGLPLGGLRKILMAVSKLCEKVAENRVPVNLVHTADEVPALVKRIAVGGNRHRGVN